MHDFEYDHRDLCCKYCDARPDDDYFGDDADFFIERREGWG